MTGPILPGFAASSAGVQAMAAAGESETETDRMVRELFASDQRQLSSSLQSAASMPGSGVTALGTGFVLTPTALLALLRQRLGDLDHQVGVQIESMERATRTAEELTAKLDAVRLVRSEMAAQNPDSSKDFRLSDLEVEWNGQKIRADRLFEELGLHDVPTDSAYGIESSDADAVEDPDHMTGEELSETLHETRNDRKKARRRFRWAKSGRLRRKEERLEKDVERVAANNGETSTGHYSVNQTVNGASLDSYIDALNGQVRRANSGNEMRMVQLQSITQQRSQAIQLVTQMLAGLNDSNKTVLQNIR